MTVHHNLYGMEIRGNQSLIKSSTVSFKEIGIFATGDRAQVEQSTANNNRNVGISADPNCLVTKNTANENGSNLPGWGIIAYAGCTVSYNTARNNTAYGIYASETTTLITHNTAVKNSVSDFHLACPSNVTYNTSTNGFPASYMLLGNGCKTVGNE